MTSEDKRAPLDARLELRISRQELRFLKRLAAEIGDNPSQWVRRAIRQAVTQKGWGRARSRRGLP